MDRIRIRRWIILTELLPDGHRRTSPTRQAEARYPTTGPMIPNGVGRPACRARRGPAGDHHDVEWSEPRVDEDVDPAAANRTVSLLLVIGDYLEPVSSSGDDRISRYLAEVTTASRRS
jgi:hypothetical protein